MALSNNVVSVPANTATALHTAGPTSVTVRNLSTDAIKIGQSGAGNQKFPLDGGDRITLTITATDVVTALSPVACQVAVITN